MFSDRCTGKLTENLAVRVTVTLISVPSTAGRQYAIAHVAIEGGPALLHYGPGDFRFVASNGQTYDAASTTPMPESSNKILGRGTLVPGDEAQGDVIFDVPNGVGTVTYRSEFGGTPVTWATSS